MFFKLLFPFANAIMPSVRLKAFFKEGVKQKYEINREKKKDIVKCFSKKKKFLSFFNLWVIFKALKMPSMFTDNDLIVESHHGNSPHLTHNKVSSMDVLNK